MYQTTGNEIQMATARCPQNIHVAKCQIEQVLREYTNR